MKVLSQKVLMLKSKHRAFGLFLQWSLTIGLGVIGIYAAWLVAQLIWFEIQPAHHGGDGALYTSIGRAILNGYVPYKDLFEFKPPGMFLISALSLHFFDDIRLGNFLQGVCELGIIIFLTWSAIPKRTERSNMYRWCIVLGSFIISALLVHYLVDRSGHFQSESFGAFFAIAFFAYMKNVDRRDWKFVLVASLLIAASIGIKETLLGAIVAGSLILSPLRQYVRNALIPLILSCLLGEIVLAALGYLLPYLTIYLPEMIHGRMSFNHYPLWSLGILSKVITRDLWMYSPALTITFALLWCSSLARSAKINDVRTMKVCILLIISFATLYLKGADRLVRMFIQNINNSLLLPVSIFVLIYLALTTFILFRILEYPKAKNLLRSFLLHVSAVIIVVAFINIGGALRQQMGLIVPLFATLMMNVFDQSRIEYMWLRLARAVIIGVSCIGIIGLPHINSHVLLADRITQEKESRARAELIDNVMDDCGYERYLIFGTVNVPFEFTRHSPYGPTFHRPSFIFPVRWRNPPIPYIQNTWISNMRSAPFAIAASLPEKGENMIDTKDIPLDIAKEFAQSMRLTPPACAAQYQAPPGFVFLFRREV